MKSRLLCLFLERHRFDFMGIMVGTIKGYSGQLEAYDNVLFLWGTCITLRGDSSLSRTPLSMRAIHKTQDVSCAALLWQVAPSTESLTLGSSIGGNLHSDISTLFFEFVQVFFEVTSLPPCKYVDHRIPLKPGTKSISIKFYRYAHTQKMRWRN